MSNNTIEVKINGGGTLEVVTIPVKLYKDSYKAIKLRVKAPKVEGAILKVYGSDRDEAGEEVWTTSAHTLSWKEYVVINSQDYSVYEDYIPKEFCQKNGELYLTFGLGMMDGESWTAILTSGTLNLYVSGEGFNFAGVEIPESDKLAYKINKTFENYERLSEDIERIDQLADDIEDVLGVSQDALSKAEEALVKVQDANDTKVFVGGVKVDEFNADTKANVSDLERKVDKVIGKGLSTYDFDDTAKNKLDGIQDGANKTIIDNVLSVTSTNPVQNKVITEALNKINTGGSVDLSGYLSVKGGEMSGDILFKSGNVKFQKTENGMTTNYTMLGEDYVGSNASSLEIRGTEITFKNRPTVNGTAVATVDDIGAGGGSGVVSNEAIEFAESERLKTINLFNKDNPNILHAYTSGGDGVLVEDSDSVTVYIKCKPNTTYTAQKIAGQQNNLSWTNVTSPPTVGTPFFDRYLDLTGTTATITTGNNATYLLYVVKTGTDTLSVQEVLNSVQIEEGSVATDYQEYNGKILHEADIEASGSVEPNIITGGLLANYTLASSNQYYDLPLIKYDSVGTKLSINSSGGIVVGDGVSHVKVSASCPMTWGGYSGQIMVAIRKNSELVHFVWAMIKSNSVNTLPCSLSPVVIPVTSGDVITLNAWKNEISSVTVEGHNSAPRTSLTVEVVE